MLHTAQVARVAVIGPGLDFIDKNEESGYDYYPQQTLQPFALYDSLVRLGLARNKRRIHVDLRYQFPGDRPHPARPRTRPQEHRVYHPVAARHRASVAGRMSSPTGERWGIRWEPRLRRFARRRFFNPSTEGRAWRLERCEVRPDVVLACEPADLNIVLERPNLAAEDRFDVVVGTNIFVYYGPFEQALALENVGAMLKPGGLLLTNDRLPEVPGGSMRLAGVTDVRIENQGARSGASSAASSPAISIDAIGWYQKR